jgi:leucyl/phenylalanyl-tRNA--protein transferase
MLVGRYLERLGMDLDPIVNGYAQGFFLMAESATHPVDWYTTHERALIPLDDRFRYPRSLQRVINQQRFELAINRDFVGVVNGCAARDNTWISAPLKTIYQQLHQAGWAYSFEAWAGGRLAAGILGIAIGAAFIGESMFFRVPDASKVAMVGLVHHLKRQQFQIFDAQIMNPHLERFGAYEIPQAEYLRLLEWAIATPVSFLAPVRALV